MKHKMTKLEVAKLILTIAASLIAVAFIANYTAFLAANLIFFFNG